MSDLQSKMSAHQNDIERAKEQIHETTQKADSYLTDHLTIVFYEKNHSTAEPATQYLKSALDASRSATQKLKTQGQDLSERSVPVAIDGMHQVRDSLDELQQQAIKYDDKYAGSRGQNAMDTLQHWVNSGRQRATDAMETTNEQLMKLRDAIGNMADEKLGVSSKAGGVVQKVRDLDARLGVTATAAKVDTKITGGLGCKMASTTVDMVTESVSYISETLHNAKLAAQHSETAQSVEAKGEAVTGAVAAKKNEVQSTFNEAVEQAKEKTGMATEKTEEKAGKVKDMTAEKAGEVKDMTAEKADEAKEMAKDKAKMTKEKAGEATEMTKDKAQQTKEAAKEQAGMAKDKTQEKADETKEKSKGMVGQAMDKAGELKDKGKEQIAMAKGKMESKTMKSKEPTTTQEETTTEKLLEGAKQTGAKESEASKTAAGSAKEHGKHVKVSGDVPGFQQAQQHAKKSSK
eukprot:jgi/Phyca11/21581/fgenesh1_pg.PHYCAscaffold_102_\